MTDDDLLALITDEVNQPVTLWSLLDLQVISPDFVTLPTCVNVVPRLWPDSPLQ